MKRLIGIIFIVSGLFLGLSGCNQSETSSFEEIITIGDLSRFGIPRVEKIGDWYPFNREELKVWVRISKASITKCEGFHNMLYFDEAKIVYPSSWEIVFIRSDGNLYQINTKRSKDAKGYAAFFVGLLGQEFATKDGQKWYLKKDGDKKTIETLFMRRDAYDKSRLNW